MKRETDGTKKKRSVKKIVLWIVAGFLLVLSVTAVYLYNNFNRILSRALNKSFNSSLISDVYELKFEKIKRQFFDRQHQRSQCNIATKGKTSTGLSIHQQLITLKGR